MVSLIVAINLSSTAPPGLDEMLDHRAHRACWRNRVANAVIRSDTTQ
ncbi:hypothetical protein BF49_1335 [Bradyrhizobium sp.]|nr:hypothetical protein BF49_1335 [Bradyrhizobium sp.]